MRGQLASDLDQIGVFERALNIECAVAREQNHAVHRKQAAKQAGTDLAGRATGHIAVGKAAKYELPAIEPVGALQAGELQTADHGRIDVQLAAGEQALAAVLSAK